ncbi:MAG: SIR2 family protein [Bacillota bacterium]
MCDYLKEIERCFGDRPEWQRLLRALSGYPRTTQGEFPPFNELLTWLDEMVAARQSICGLRAEQVRFELLRLFLGCLTKWERCRRRFTWDRHADAIDSDAGTAPWVGQVADEPDRWPLTYNCADIAPSRHEPPSPAYGPLTYLGVYENATGRGCDTMHVPQYMRAREQTPSQPRNQANNTLARLAIRRRASVISTNYDLIFDQALEDCGIMPDYCVDPSRSQRGLRLLKIHGSVNWLVCLDCGCVGVWPDSYPTQSLFAGQRVEHSCPRCGQANWADMLVTPSRRRSQPHFSLKQIWKAARDELSRATLVVFIGYSLPDEDEDVRNLLREGIGAHAEVLVVDPSVSTVARYRQFFEGGRVESILQPLSPSLWEQPEVALLLDRLWPIPAAGDAGYYFAT